MNIIQFSIQNPVKVTVGVILIVLFGIIALSEIPIQLTPDIDRPVITIRTSWPGRSPEEVEESILLEQEEKLKSVEGLWKMTSTANTGSASITLEFAVGTSPERILQEVSNKLDEVPEYPEDVDRPVVDLADTAGDNAIAYLLLQADSPDFDVATFYDYADRYLKPSLERIEGVAEIDMKGGREHQVQVRFDPIVLAQRGITVKDLQTALRQDNMNVSAGDLVNNRQDVRFRVLGQYNDLQKVRNTIIRYGEDDTPIRIQDVAEVALVLEKSVHFDQCKGRTSMTIFVKRRTGANVLKVLEEVRKVTKELNAPDGPLRQFKNDRYGLSLRIAFEESDYIYSAVGLVVENLIFGGALAIIVLLLFLRSIRSTLIIAVSIPISVIGTFVVMWLTGRNLNVISLAGLSFAVGMVVDNAIVVLENIDRHLALGYGPFEASLKGTREVWGAILSSTLTTIAVFAPVLTIHEEAGQLFNDIALAICAAVSLSLIVSITVIPSASAIFLKHHKSRGPIAIAMHSIFGLTSIFSKLNDAWSRVINLLMLKSVSSFWLRTIIILTITVGSLLISQAMMPPASYLPNGNKNFTFGRMSTPPSYSLMENYTIGERIEEAVKPFWSAKNAEEASSHGPVVDIQTGEVFKDIPTLKEFFFVVARGSVFMIAVSQDPNNVEPIKSIFSKAMAEIPGCHGVAGQASLFGRGSGSSNAVDIEISGDDLQRLKSGTDEIMKRLQTEYSKFAVRSSPANFNESGPEFQIQVDQSKIKSLKLSVGDLATTARALIDGVFVGDFNFEGDNIDLIVIRDPAISITPDEIPDQPISVRDDSGQAMVIPIGELADFVRANASQSIRRVEQQRAILLTVTPPSNVALEQAQDRILEIIKETRQEGIIGNDIMVNLSGNADRLSQVEEALLGKWTGWNEESLLSVGLSRMFLALVITYLLMTALFESFVYPLVILFSVPMATVGGFIGLAIVHSITPSQQLDVLTMLGFVILIGIVVNNAILIVHQSLNFMRDEENPMAPREAISESVRTRIRPILMTTCTSLFGMLPLVIAPGAGSELYRGLGSVVIGGLVCATFFTLIVVPLLLSLTLDIQSLLSFRRQAKNID